MKKIITIALIITATLTHAQKLKWHTEVEYTVSFAVNTYYIHSSDEFNEYVANFSNLKTHKNIGAFNPIQTNYFDLITAHKLKPNKIGPIGFPIYDAYLTNDEIDNLITRSDTQYVEDENGDFRREIDVINFKKKYINSSDIEQEWLFNNKTNKLEVIVNNMSLNYTLKSFYPYYDSPRASYSERLFLIPFKKPSDIEADKSLVFQKKIIWANNMNIPFENNNSEINIYKSADSTDYEPTKRMFDLSLAKILLSKIRQKKLPIYKEYTSKKPVLDYSTLLNYNDTQMIENEYGDIQMIVQIISIQENDIKSFQIVQSYWYDNSDKSIKSKILALKLNLIYRKGRLLKGFWVKF